MTQRQELFVQVLQQFVTDENSTVLFVVLPNNHFGKNYALTEWFTRCTREQCRSIKVVTPTGIEARELLTQTRAKMPDRQIIRIDPKRFIELENTPRIAFGASPPLRGTGRQCLHIYMKPAFSAHSDREFRDAVLTGKSVWFIDDEEQGRAELLAQGAKFHHVMLS